VIPLKSVRAHVLAPLIAGLVASCSSGSDTIPTPPADQADDSASSARVEQRLAALQAAVDSWERADDLTSAKAAAETARNLVTGPDVTGYGDSDRDGRIGGGNAAGLLPGEEGQPGLVTSPAPACIERDVLGGSWADPAARWQEVRRRIAAWSETNNTFPALASHPQRVVGWASLTLAARSLELAREYAGHAQLHVRITLEALEGC
jgi:hypothetical protein